MKLMIFNRETQETQEKDLQEAASFCKIDVEELRRLLDQYEEIIFNIGCVEYVVKIDTLEQKPLLENKCQSLQTIDYLIKESYILA